MTALYVAAFVSALLVLGASVFTIGRIVQGFIEDNRGES
jgi:hypothetical protein